MIIRLHQKKYGKHFGNRNHISLGIIQLFQRGINTARRKSSMKNPTYVVGHVNPDTDSIASAVGYAWLLHERDGTETIAERAGYQIGRASCRERV